MPELRFISGVFVATGLLLALAPLLRLPPSAVLFVGGLVSILLPGLLPPVPVEPQAVLELMLPPLLYAGTVALSLDLLWHALARGLLGGAVLVLSIILSVALTTHLLLPGLDPTACLLLGITLAIGDTRLVQETGQARHLPRLLTDAFAGQAVSARLVVVTLFLLAQAAIGGPPPSPGQALLRLAIDLLVGGAIGLAVGLGAVGLRRQVRPATTEVAITVATPFLAAQLAAVAGVSVAVVIVAAALTVSARAVDRATGEAISSAEARVVVRHVWSAIAALLSAALFFLMGRALPEALVGLGRYGWGHLGLVAMALLALVLALQFLLALLILVLPGTKPAPGADGRPAGRVRTAVVAAWSGHRSAIAFALALSIPGAADGRPFPERDLVLALTALVIVASGLLQGTTLPRVVAWAGLGGAAEEEQEQHLARAAVMAAQGHGPNPEADAAQGRQALVRLREADAIGDTALRAADQAITLQAHAEQVSGKDA